MTNYRISFQLYSARKFPPVAAQLEALAAIGYDAVEPYGGAYQGDVGGFRELLRGELGTRTVGDPPAGRKAVDRRQSHDSLLH